MPGRSGLPQGLVGIGNEIGDDVMELMRIGPEQRQVFGQVALDGNAVRLQGVLKQDEHVANDCIEHHGTARWLGLPRQGQKVFHHTLATFHRLPE